MQTNTMDSTADIILLLKAIIKIKLIRDTTAASANDKIMEFAVTTIALSTSAELV